MIQVIVSAFFLIILGPFGFFAFLLSILFARLLKAPPPPPTAKAYQIPVSIEAQIRTALQYTPPTLEKQLDLLSYRETLQFEKFDQRRNILSMLSFHPNPENMAIIQEASHNQDPVVQILARTAMQHVEDQWRARIEELEKLVEEKSSKNDPEMLAIYFELGNLYEELLTSGLLPLEIKNHFRTRLLRWYLKAMKEDPANLPIRLRYAKVCNKLGLFAQAESVSRDIVSLEPHHPEANLILMESCFLAGKYEEVQFIADELDPRKFPRAHAVHKSLDYWTESAKVS